MKKILFIIFLAFSISAFSQKTYEDSMKAYFKSYVDGHEVVQGKDKQQMHFYEVNKSYRVVASFKPSSSSQWLSFKTSGKQNQTYRLFGTLNFTLNKKACSLNVYQSQDLISNPQYKDYLFLPFTDLTTGKETYASGRYLDLRMGEIKNNKVTIDFNKAYNPYCAYVSGVYNCPIPPKENALAVEVKAGEKMFTGSH